MWCRTQSVMKYFLNCDVLKNIFKIMVFFLKKKKKALKGGRKQRKVTKTLY